jgi:hypothetical protein
MSAELAVTSQVNGKVLMPVLMPATAFCKPSIILFDTRAGTRNFTVPPYVRKIRVFVVGAGGNGHSASNGRGGGGGGYSEKEYDVTPGDVISYTVGASPGGTSSWDADITATGGATGTGSGAATGGVGSGTGATNTNGGDGGNVNNSGGGSSGQRFGNGITSIDSVGAGWGNEGVRLNAVSNGGDSAGIDGWGIGVLPGQRGIGSGGTGSTASPSIGLAMYGSGGGSWASTGGLGQSGGPGGGGGRGNSSSGDGGIGGGGAMGLTAEGIGLGGFGLVGVEVLEMY